MAFSGWEYLEEVKSVNVIAGISFEAILLKILRLDTKR